jgi:hypothetical protein
MLKKYWPALAHAGATAVVFLNPSVQTYAAAHPGYAAPVVLIWGVLLHLATSPLQK